MGAECGSEGHTMPHVLQFCGLWVVSTQLEPQRTSGGVQSATQLYTWSESPEQ